MTASKSLALPAALALVLCGASVPGSVALAQGGPSQAGAPQAAPSAPAPAAPAAAPSAPAPTPPSASPNQPARRATADSPSPPRSALARATPAQVAEWVRLIAGRPLNRTEAASLLRGCGVDADSDPALAAALDAALGDFRERWDAFAKAELIPVSEQRGTSLADLAVDPSRSAAFIIDLRARRHALEDAMIDTFARALPESARPRAELAKSVRGSQVPVWATGTLIPAGTTVPVLTIAWQADFVPPERREQVRALVEPLIASHGPQRGKLMDGLLRATLESDLMADRIAADASRAATAARESGAEVDGNRLLGLAMSRQLMPMMCAAGDLQSATARLLEALKGALPPRDFDALMQMYAKAASVPLAPQLDADAVISNARKDGTLTDAQVTSLAGIAEAWRSDDALLLMSWAQSLPEFSRSMCDTLTQLPWDNQEELSKRPMQDFGHAKVQQRQMQLVQARADRAAAAVAAMQAQLTREEWERVKPVRAISWGAPKGSTP